MANIVNNDETFFNEMKKLRDEVNKMMNPGEDAVNDDFDEQYKPFISRISELYNEISELQNKFKVSQSALLEKYLMLVDMYSKENEHFDDDLTTSNLRNFIEELAYFGNKVAEDFLIHEKESEKYHVDLIDLLGEVNSLKNKMRNAILLGVSAEKYSDSVLDHYKDQDINELLRGYDGDLKKLIITEAREKVLKDVKSDDYSDDYTDIFDEIQSLCDVNVDKTNYRKVGYKELKYSEREINNLIKYINEFPEEIRDEGNYIYTSDIYTSDNDFSRINDLYSDLSKLIDDLTYYSLNYDTYSNAMNSYKIGCNKMKNYLSSFKDDSKYESQIKLIDKMLDLLDQRAALLKEKYEKFDSTDDDLTTSDDQNVDYEEDTDDNSETYILYIDNNRQFYAPAVTLNRFGVFTDVTPIKIYGVDCYKISDEVAKLIKQEEQYGYDSGSKVNIQLIDVNLGKKKDEDENENEAETITIYKDITDDDQLYTSRTVLDRFSICPIGKSVEIEGNECYKIDRFYANAIQVKVEEIKNNTGKNIVAEYKNVLLDKNMSKITVYYDVNDNYKMYTTIGVLSKFGIKPNGDPVQIKGKNCYLITTLQDKEISKKAREINPEIKVVYEEINKENKKEKPSIDDVLAKLTNNLDNPKTSDASICKMFKDELFSGPFLYNIVNHGPGLLKNLKESIKMKINSFLADDEEIISETIKKRLDSLSDEELEVLFAYKEARDRDAIFSNIDSLVEDKLNNSGKVK